MAIDVGVKCADNEINVHSAHAKCARKDCNRVRVEDFSWVDLGRLFTKDEFNALPTTFCDKCLS